MSLVADLHIHTTNSDGQMELGDVIATAQREDLTAIAITDHDRVHPELDAPISERDGITIIHGMELRVETPFDERVDLLGYAVDPTPALRDEINRLQADRANRAQRMIDRVEEALRIDLPIEGEAGMGRPDIARAIAEHDGTDYGYEDAFQEIIGHDCPAYVSRNVTSFEDGVKLLSDACALVGLAHPFRYENVEQALDVTRHLGALECSYPYSAPDAGEGYDLDPVVDKYDLVRTGGTDAHAFTVGEAGLEQEEYDAVRRAIRE